MKKNINYSLLEDTRPPLYTAMKYWGKKPHNVWNEYIKTYTSKEGFYLDPFTGSAMSAFESYKAGRKAFAFDINPLTSFVIELYSYEFDYRLFETTARDIINKIEQSEIYCSLFRYKSDYKQYTVHNVKWSSNSIFEICLQGKEARDRLCLKPDREDFDAVEFSKNIEIKKIYPTRSFRESVSFSKTFLSNIGDNFSCLYTKRNLWVLSELFDSIKAIDNLALKNQLLYAFLQTVHLSTKMCVPRGKSAKRDFSTSWGRSAYLYSKNQMEMNPLLVFKSSCFGKQSAGNALMFANSYFVKKPCIANINKVPFAENKKVDIWYGVIDAKNITNHLPKGIIDFVLTDPPYGGLVQYLDLSSIWLSWLELVDKKYIPNYSDEITINLHKNNNSFQEDIGKVLKNIHYLLKDDGYLVLTFNNNDIKIWGALLKAILIGGFEIEKVIHQQNKRTGESNVSDPYGTSGTDFYIRCKKSSFKEPTHYTKTQLENIVISKINELIEERNEPTPYQILFNGLLAKLSSSNIDLSCFDEDLKKFMEKHLNKEFVIYDKAKNKSGNYWWIKDKKFNCNNKNTLTTRVDRYISYLISKNTNASEDFLIQEIFKKFPNGLTPDIEIVYELIYKNAVDVR